MKSTLILADVPPVKRVIGRPPKKGEVRRKGPATGPYKVTREFWSDKRTKLGRLYIDIKRGLIKEIGGHATASQELLIEEIAAIKLRLAQYRQLIIDEEDFSSFENGTYIREVSTLRRLLAALGLDVSHEKEEIELARKENDKKTNNDPLAKIHKRVGNGNVA